MTADLAERLQWMVADGRNMGVNEQTIDLDVIEQAASALRSSAEAVAWAVRDHSDGKLWMVDTDQAHASRQAELNDDTLVPLYLRPATPASAPDWNMAQHWIDRYAGGIDDELQLDRVAEALGLPDPTPPTSTKGG